MANAGGVAFRQTRQRNVPSPKFAAKESRRASDKCPRRNRRFVQPRKLSGASAFLERAIHKHLSLRSAAFRSRFANRKLPVITPTCAPELRPARMEFPAAGLWHLQRGL